MNSNQEKPGRSSLIIVISLHFFFFNQVGQRGGIEIRVDNCSQGCKKVCQIKLESYLKIYLRLYHSVLIVPGEYPTKTKISFLSAPPPSPPK